MFEHKSQTILPAHQFAFRMLKVILSTAAVLSLVIGGGVIGFMVTGAVGWIDALHHAVWVAMGNPGDLHRGNPPQNHLLFESAYVLVSRLVLFTSAAFVVTPIFHRIMHKLHLDDSP